MNNDEGKNKLRKLRVTDCCQILQQPQPGNFNSIELMLGFADFVYVCLFSM